MQKMPATDHTNNFDFIRLAAALLVLVSHQFALQGLPEPGLKGLHSLGGLSVLVFFSISGYLVAQSWLNDPHLLRFAAKRLLRIVPGLVVVMAACTFILGPLVTHLSLKNYFTNPSAWQYMVFKSSTLPLKFEGNVLPYPINGTLWTIPLELKCYGLLALLGLLGLLRDWWGRISVTVLLFTVLAIYGLWEVRGDLLIARLQWSGPTRFLLEFGLFFFAGSALCLWRVLELKRQQTVLLLTGTLIAAAIALAFDRMFLAVWLILPLAMVLLGHAATPYLRRAGRFGDLSYGVYIYAFPVQQTIFWLYKDELGWWALMAVVVAITVLLAFASWHLVEKPALRYKPRRAGATTKPAFLPAVAAG